MDKGEQRVKSGGWPAYRQSLGFISVCGVAFVVSVAATVYSCRSMCCEMEMPGGWTMSAMWMRMPGQTWLTSAAMFLLMWLVMMVAMMLPSAMPMLLNFHRCLTKNGHPGAHVTFVALGYFSVWMLIGAAAFVLGATLVMAATHLEWFSRLVPGLSGAVLVAAGAFQFTTLKMSALRQCRDTLRCVLSREPSGLTGGWCQGLNQGKSCLVCCAAPMLTLVALGTMNMAVMTLAAIVITMEKLLPKPEPIVRVSGAVILTTGAVMIVKSFL